MSRVWWHIAGRFYEARAARAYARYRALSERAAKFFSYVGSEK